MSQTKSQLERVRGQLHERGVDITRNECLSQYPAITRPGARIDDLKREGYRFETEHRAGDYVYELVSAPTPETLGMFAA